MDLDPFDRRFPGTFGHAVVAGELGTKDRLFRGGGDGGRKGAREEARVKRYRRMMREILRVLLSTITRRSKIKTMKYGVESLAETA